MSKAHSHNFEDSFHREKADGDFCRIVVNLDTCDRACDRAGILAHFDQVCRWEVKKDLERQRIHRYHVRPHRHALQRFLLVGR